MDKYNITYKTADGTVHAAIEFGEAYSQAFLTISNKTPLALQPIQSITASRLDDGVWTKIF